MSDAVWAFVIMVLLFGWAASLGASRLPHRRGYYEITGLAYWLARRGRR